MRYLIAFGFLLSVDIDALLVSIFNGPGPSVEIGDTSTPLEERITIKTLSDGTVVYCYVHKNKTRPYACIA